VNSMLKYFCVLSTIMGLACTNGGNVGATNGVTGAVTVQPGYSLPGAGDVFAVWTVSSGSPDYLYVSGSGQLTEAGFELELPATLPDEAINSYGVGVGLIYALPSAYVPPPGRLDETLAPDRLAPSFIGITPRYAVIYRKPGATPPSPASWMEAFPEGYSCGVGVPAIAGDIFDTYAPVDCSMVELVVGDPSTFDFVNWT